MSGQRYSVTIDVGANISSARQALSELQRLFGKNFSQSGNKQMFNLFGGLEKALDELETKSSKAITSLAQQKELDNARKKVMDFFDAIQTESKKISSLGGTDFAKRLEGLGTQLSSAAKAWSTYQSSVKAAMKEQDSLTSKKDNLTTTLENQKKALADLQKELDKYVGRNNEISKARGAETKAKNESAVAQKDLTAAKSAETRARKQYENYITTEKLIKDAQGKIDEKASKKNLGFIDSSAITIAKQYYNEIVKIQKALANTKTNPADIPGLKKSLADKTTQYEDFLKANNLQKNALGGVDEAAASLFNKSISQKIEEAQNLYKQLEIKANEVKAKQKEFDSKEKIATGKTAEVTALEGKKSEIESKIADLQNAVSKTESDLKQAQAAFDDFFKAGKDTAAFDKLKEDLRNLFGDDFVKDMQNTEQGLENIKQKIESIGGDKIAQAKQDLESFNNSLSNGQLANDLDKINNKFAQTGEQVLRAEQQIKEIEHIKSRIQYFFGLANAINLVKRAIRSSFNTVKELDKAMTETAVVTDYTIKDMWKQLPEYTKRANQLGVTTKEAYESATLYYQQGLNTEQAAALSTETLKMARIAGLDAADATDRMTNALRGFNMELNATQAQRVDDVYSQLAAMSASNVDEISTAMTKVASLANNANMEFETTAAFLAQIIESTRESAETAGTALKTVVARFSEVKKLYDKEELKGQDEEGQIIDVNKISAALRTAGIDLNKYFLGEVGLDDIFIELASKWDSLTNIQQRYIATQAAGSRQQSRFIALMADYKRTQELVGAAYNSTGASEKQFEKTQDSMQSKLARLKNAWDEFAMGLANNTILKGAVDVLTTLLQVINKVTSAFGNGVGSVLKWTAAISALSGVRKLFMGGGFVDKALGTVLNGTIFGKGLFEKGILSGFLFGGKHVAGSKAQEILQEQAANGGSGTTIRTGGLFNNLFNGNLKKKIADFKKENANLMPQIIEQGIDDTTGRPITDTAFIPSPENTSLFAAFGNKFQKSKIGGAISKIPTHFGGTALSGAATLGVTLGAVAAAAAAAYGAYKLWERFSPEGQLKQATEFSKAMDQAAESANQAKKSTKEVYDTYTEKDKAVEEATSITGRNKAIEDRNTYINDLLKQNESYAKYLKTEFKDGQLQLTLDNDALKNVANEAEKAATKTAIGANLAKAMQAGKQANVYRVERQRAGVQLEERTIRDYDEEGKAYQRQMTDRELAKYTDLEVKASERDKVAKGFAKSAYSQMIDGEALGDEFGELVAGVLAEGFDENKYYESIKDQQGGTWWNWTRSRSHWQEEYLKAYGTEADSSMKTADIARAVAQRGAQDQQQVQADNLSKLVEANKTAYEPLLKAINGVFEGKITLETDTTAFVEDLKKGVNFEAVASAMGKTIPELERILEANIKAQKEIQVNNLSNLAIKGKRAGASQEFFGKIAGMQPDQVAKLFDFADIAEKSLGDGFADFLNNLDTTQLDAYKDFFSGFDLDQPLQAVKRLNSAIKDDTNPTIQALATQVKEANKPLFDTGYLTQFFMTSEAYEGISESLEKFIEDNKEISADNINELAESCSDLKTLLNETDVNAQGLARAFTAIGKGEGSIEGITSAVLEALGAVKTATTAIDSLSKSIDDFDAGRDFGKAVDFANEKIDTLRNSLESLDFGNETFKKNYEYFFKDYEKFVKLDTEGRKSLLTQNLDRMEQLLDNDAVGAMRELVNKGIGVSQLDTEGFQFDWKVEGDWDTTVEQVAKALDVNTQIAETVVAAAAKHIPNLLESMDAKGYEQTLNSFAEAARENTIITTQELEILAAATGKRIEQLREDFDKADLKLPIEVNWQDKDGNNLTGDDLLKQAQKVYDTVKFQSEAIRASAHDVFDNTFDPTKLTNAIQNSLKVSPAQAKEIADDYVKTIGGSFEQVVQVPVKITNEDGSETWELKPEIAQGATIDDLEAQVKLKEDQAQWTAYADAMKTAITQALEIAPNGDASNAITDITTQLSAQTFTVKVKGEYVGTEGVPTGNSLGVTNSEAKVGIVSSYASGSRHIKPGVALTGEEGPELVWNKKEGYAYLVGKHGPEFADLVPGDQVFPAGETKEIINRGVTPSLAKGGKVVPSYDEGAWDKSGGRKKGKDSGDGSGDKDDEFKMDLDKYYNMVEDINELLRLRNLLEKDYNQLLKTEGKTGKEIYDNLNRQLKLLEERSKIVADLAEKRKQQIIDEVAANQEYQKYAWWNNEDLTIEIDWDLVTSITDKDEGGKVKDYLSKLEDFQSKYDDMIEQLEEIEDTIQDIRERGKDQYNTLEERVRDALIKQIQDKIDELQDVDKAINDTNQKLFDSMQETLSMQRQQRDNAKTEEGLTDKEKRLAYLRQDSSNANQLEIAKLQEELADERQNYTDTLIDQKISELQQQNNQAQEQRQEQIELMQRSLDWQEKSGAFWETVYQYISEGTDAIGALVKQSELERLLMSAEPWDKLSEEQKLNWVNDLMDQVAQGIAYLELSRQLEDIGTKEGASISFTNANGQTLTGKADKNGNVVVTNSDGSTITYKDVFQDYHGAYRTFETSGEAKAAPKPVTSTAKPTTSVSSGNGNSGSRSTGSENTENNKKFKEFKYVNYGNADSHKVYRVYTDNSEELVGTEGHSFEFRGVSADNRIFVCSKCSYKKTVKNDSAYIGSTGKTSGNSTEQTLNFPFSGGGGGGRVMLRYASGGLNTQAGPAWLDGTASNPELVLNARDTQNFIELKDVLADMRKNGGLSLTGGDNYYNISVNVDQMSSDYDVDRAIDRIKARIAQDGAYRNVNTLSRLR